MAELRQHAAGFDEAYKDRLCHFAKGEVEKENQKKYSAKNQVQLSYLVLSKKSRKRIGNSYFQGMLNAQRMDGLLAKLHRSGIIQNN
jgi:hypothetical protein